MITNWLTDACMKQVWGRRLWLADNWLVSQNWLVGYLVLWCTLLFLTLWWMCFCIYVQLLAGSALLCFVVVLSFSLCAIMIGRFFLNKTVDALVLFCCGNVSTLFLCVSFNSTHHNHSQSDHLFVYLAIRFLFTLGIAKLKKRENWLESLKSLIYFIERKWDGELNKNSQTKPIWCWIQLQVQ